MAMMKYGASSPATLSVPLKTWGQVKTASVKLEEEEERKKAQQLARK